MSTESRFSRTAAHLTDAVPTLFPAGVVAAEMTALGDPSLLFPAELECVERAVARRRQEFAAGRQCARRALDEFGIHAYPLLAGPDRLPIWPQSIVGSISHTAGYCVAVVAASSQLRAVGVDSERVGAVEEELWATICVPDEAAWLESLPLEDHAAAITLLFSAKEAFYKCQFPLTEEWLDFHDVRIELDNWGQESAEFTVHANRDLRFATFTARPFRGRYRFFEGFVTTGFALTQTMGHQ